MPAFNTRMLQAAVGACLAASAIATPTPVEREAVTPAAVLPRATSSSKISNEAQLASSFSTFSSFSQDAAALSAAISDGIAIFEQIVPTPGPTAAAQVQAELQQIQQAYGSGDVFRYGAELLLNGLSGGDLLTIAEAYSIENSQNNFNPNPPTPIYPKKESDDAPYDLSEAQLRKIIYIPPGFTYGRIPPVLFLPGTGVLAGTNFGPNFGKLFAQNKIADPVYVNVPGLELDDLQTSAEYVAYAVNYISAISGGKNVSTISWSAGSLTGQWALKYWPSTRKVLSNKIGLSADYHGTDFAYALCPGFPTPGSDPGVCQQNYNSTFIRTLRNNGGDSAYVPTTNVYSIFDEIVQPQEDPNASGAVGDARGVGVSNTEIQKVCTPFLPAGSPFVNHEGVIYNALAYALAVDALQHSGPGQLSRVNASAACSMFAAPGLSLSDVFATEGNIPIAGLAILEYMPKVSAEPPIKAYAQKDTPAS